MPRPSLSFNGRAPLGGHVQGAVIPRDQQKRKRTIDRLIIGEEGDLSLVFLHISWGRPP